jgi:excisionase family DNA binding protein
MLGLLTTAEAAVLLRVSKSTVRRLVRVGELQPVRIGRAVRFQLETLETFARGRVAPTTTHPDSPGEVTLLTKPAPGRHTSKES